MKQKHVRALVTQGFHVKQGNEKHCEAPVFPILAKATAVSSFEAKNVRFNIPKNHWLKKITKGTSRESVHGGEAMEEHGEECVEVPWG